jgi:hypothetical protein
MAEYKRETFECSFVGMTLTVPIDRIPKNKARILENCRVYGSGAVRGRQGNVALANIPVGQVNSMFTLNDPIPSPVAFPTAYTAHARFAGVGTELWNSNESAGLNSYGLLETGFSGSPLAFVVTPSDFTPRPWVIVGDTLKMRKVSSNFAQHYPLGVAPPNFEPVIAIAAADPNGPDIGATGVPYVYAFSGQDDAYLNTGAVGLMGPAVRTVNGLSPSSATGSPPPSDILVTLPMAHPDPQVTFINVWRYGGSLPQWTLIGSMVNQAGATMLDTFSDLSIESNPINTQDDNQPFLVVDSTRTGTCTLTALGTGLGCTLTVTGGDVLRPYEADGDDPYYLAGTQISVAGTLFTFYRSPDTTTSVELLEDPMGITGGEFVMNTPEMAHQPLQCIWGPYGGGISGIFIFACGDPANPGTLYWTKGNHPESHPGANTLVLTSGSETLMNGVLWSSQPFVMSTQRMFQIFPNLGGTTDFIALEVPNSKGLYARWGICSTPQGICFVGKDGIYMSAGGPPVSLTDDDMYPLFPHEGSGSDPTSFVFVDGMNDPDPALVGIAPVDFSQPDAMRLAYGDGFLYFDYFDIDGQHRTLVYNFQSKAWVSRDTNAQSGLCTHYYEVIQDTANESVTQNQMMVGSIDGIVGCYGGATDFGSAIGSRIRPGAYDGGDPRPRKKWGDIELDLDSQCDTIQIQVGLDNFSYFAASTTSGLNYTGRRRITVDINSGLGQYAYNLGIDIAWLNSADSIPILYFWLPTWVPEPELTALRATDFDDCGYPGAKFIQGFKLRADTLNIPRTVQVLDQDGNAHAFTPTPILHSREQTIAYSFNTPFVAHLVRFLPQDANFWRIQGVEWIFEPAPELVQTWETQETTLDFPGWFHHRDIYLPIISSAVVTLAVATVENPGGPFLYTKPSTAGLYDRGYFPLQPMKALAVKYTLTSPAGFRVFVKDLSVNAKAWGSPGPFMPKKPFGDNSRVVGARI